MKFTCEVKDFIRALSEVEKATTTKATYAALAGVRLELKGNDLTLTGYNLEMGVITKIPVIGEENGVVVTNPAKVLISALSKLKGEVTIETNSQNVISVVSAKASLEFAGTSAIDYPTAPTFEAENEINGNLLSEALDSVSYAIDGSCPKPILTGALLDFENGNCSVVASTGTVIAMFEFAADVGDNKIVIPKAALKIISDFAKGKEKIHFGFTGNQCYFNDDNTEIVTRTLAGDYLNYRKVIDSATNHSKTTVDRAKFREAVDLANLLTESQRVVPMEISISSNGIDTHINTAIGKSDMHIDCDGALDLQIYFRPKFLLEALSHCSAEKVDVYLHKPLELAMIKDNFGYTAVVLPVRKQ